jgi:ferredoxin-type protein NapG
VSTFSRRDLFRGVFGRGKPAPNKPGAAPMVAYVEPAAACQQQADGPSPPAPTRFGRGQALPVLRPPGAIEEAAFLAACTRCNACVEACPHDAVTLAPARLRGTAGTPMLNPADSPCRMCSDLPCVAVCEPLALRFDLPAKMGTAAVSPLDCLAHQGTTCSACVEQCPVEGAMRWESGRPIVDPAACTGCGVCQYVCPAPRNAVLILPTLTRPVPPEVPHDRRR